jgi:FtsP/CotA-like multicopper oxidase with cupredoxin domain
LFRPGERVRLRFVNAAGDDDLQRADTGPDADGRAGRRPAGPAGGPSTNSRSAIAETYDVIVEPTEDRAYTLVGEAIDRSGMARATLAPRAGMTAEVPPLRKPSAGDDEGYGHGHGAAP